MHVCTVYALIMCCLTGAIALAEVLAENRHLTHLDLRENDVRVAGLMGLQLAHRMNHTLLNMDMPKGFKVDQVRGRKGFPHSGLPYIRNGTLETTFHTPNCHVCIPANHCTCTVVTQHMVCFIRRVQTLPVQWPSCNEDTWPPFAVLCVHVYGNTCT